MRQCICLKKSADDDRAATTIAIRESLEWARDGCWIMQPVWNGNHVGGKVLARSQSRVEAMESQSVLAEGKQQEKHPSGKCRVPDTPLDTSERVQFVSYPTS
jgi:hypothetical protein